MRLPCPNKVITTYCRDESTEEYRLNYDRVMTHAANGFSNITTCTNFILKYVNLKYTNLSSKL